MTKNKEKKTIVSEKKNITFENKYYNKIILAIYKRLLKEYSYQGWWPLIEKDAKTNRYISRYHPKNYDLPRTPEQQFEIIVGAILTQNTSWLQVEKALINLKEKNLLSPKSILNANEDSLKEAIRPAGYFNQKAERLKLISEWFINKKGLPSREELLSIKGIGKETADSILLYAYKQPSFVVDAYTRRLLFNLGLIQNIKEKYDTIKELFENSLPKDFKIFQEYHALIVAHAKQFYKGKGKSKEYFLKELFND